MRFVEWFNETFFTGYATGQIAMGDVLLCLLCTTAIAFFIHCVYRVINKNSFYNKAFDLSVMVLAVITSAIILTIQSNIVVSLGMVGALSIVRFRTAIKDPMDLVFLFWSISAGIICGAGFALIAVVASVVIALIIAAVTVSVSGRSTMVLVVNAASCADEQAVMETVHAMCKYVKVRARNASRHGLNMAIEVRVEDEAALISDLLALECVSNASLVEHDGNITA